MMPYIILLLLQCMLKDVFEVGSYVQLAVSIEIEAIYIYSLNSSRDNTLHVVHIGKLGSFNRPVPRLGCHQLWTLSRDNVRAQTTHSDGF